MNPTPNCHCDGLEPDIIALAFAVVEATAQLAARVRTFYYEVVLAGHACPQCAGHLHMRREGQCACEACEYTFDPTLAFQECSTCGGQPRVRIRRYECRCCGAEVRSRFLFDGLIFDAEYFRTKMAESRQRQQARREQVQERLAGSRSETLETLPIALDGFPDLIAVLNSLSTGTGPPVRLSPREEFNLRRYETHITACLQTIPITFDEIPPLSENTLYDRVWRFIALLFLAQAGSIQVWQEGPTIFVMSHEADREGQAVPGNVEAADGIA